MSFTDGKAFRVTQGEFDAFKRLNKHFGCSLCGHEFRVDDSARLIFDNGTPNQGTGNFFVCHKCDEPSDESILAKAKESRAIAVKMAKQWGIYGPDWVRP